MSGLVMLPSDLGLPRPTWRPGQWEMVWDISECTDRHQILNAPTGFGKSLTYMGIAALTGWRIVILTETKALQDQLSGEFAEWGLIDVRGQSNYRCNAPDHGELGLGAFFRRNREYTVREGPCRRGIKCALKDGGCAYYDRVRLASQSTVITTNYDFWFHNREKMGRVDLLVLDEAHAAPDALADFLSFRVTPAKLRLTRTKSPDGDDVREWQAWARYAAVRATEMLADEWSHDLSDWKAELDRMASMLGTGEWVVEHQPAPNKGAVHIDCINSEAQGKDYIWGSSKRTLLVSATANKVTAKQIGIPPNEVRLWSAKSGFPVERRPVYVVKGAVRLNHRTEEGELRMWVNLIDRIIDSRKDRKGILHTTSFARAQYFASHSRHKAMLYLNSSGSTVETVRRFTSARGPAVLVSPSVTTGWDFPMSSCEYQILGKIPFPDMRGKAAKVRAQRVPEWTGYTAAQVIVQSSGRGMRSADDQCETFIVDGNFDWWWGQNKQYLPAWFSIALKWVGLAALPAPPPPLTQGR